MTFLELINQTASQHREFSALFSQDLDQMLQQYVKLQNTDMTEYEACCEMLKQAFDDSVGVLAETWLNNR
ncbi:hypothetical protein [Parendozoicomonas haliclonae]|uniref:Uncharacterized protein n=1 Tax=Parendozoicomonas haliclonae TaxID=1960125 RepID=A0A1X7ARL0_9GAMM|nr:hypothetical protein [Parendozoicomonas haliclonae]SMA50783.1 hypothetical protein EHSB41UT_04600 [Parendozoicomonas haliclonae]